MSAKGRSGVRAAWSDAIATLGRGKPAEDPAPDRSRGGIKAGQWPGAPADILPPGCPVIPLGVDGKVSYFIDTLGQLVPVASSEWSKKMLLQLFATQPNYLYWAWPRFAQKTFAINGLEVDDAMQCLIKAAALRGMFSPADRVRGGGAWESKAGDLLWHAGDRIYRVAGSKLEAAAPGEIEGIFYPQRPAGVVPWQEPVDPAKSPVGELLDQLRSWNWERPVLDPLLVIGWLGCAFAGGALPWRPHLVTTGDKGVGKSTLHHLVKEILGASLHSTAETTPAGIYQRVKQDSLPVAIDELEAGADNRRVMALVSLARLASSGAVMYRGGSEHVGVEFQLRNTFFMSAINPPPLEPADRSRLALLNLGKLDPASVRKPPTVTAELIGRMILRCVMDGWPTYRQQLAYWRGVLHEAGMDSRGQDTWGTLLTMSNLLLGDERMEAAGLPVADPQRLGRLVARATAMERAEATDNWVDCLNHLLGSTIEAWKSGERPTIGHVLEEWEGERLSHEAANDRLGLVGLRCRDEEIAGEYDVRGQLKRRHLLVVPVGTTPTLARIYQNSKWSSGVWSTALKQAPKHIVIRDRRNGQNVKINRTVVRCIFVDLDAFEAWLLDKGTDDGED